MVTFNSSVKVSGFPPEADQVSAYPLAVEAASLIGNKTLALLVSIQV
jgi:hypothetical protein